MLAPAAPGTTTATPRQRMDELAAEIVTHHTLDPDNFDGREHLYMERENLRAQLPRPRRFT